MASRRARIGELSLEGRTKRDLEAKRSTQLSKVGASLAGLPSRSSVVVGSSGTSAFAADAATAGQPPSAFVSGGWRPHAVAQSTGIPFSRLFRAA